MRLVVLGVLLAAAALPGSPAAAADTETRVYREGTDIVIDSTGGNLDNFVDLGGSSVTTLKVRDINHPERAEREGCELSAGHVFCSLEGITRIHVHLGAGNDIVTGYHSGRVTLVVHGSLGNDVVLGGGGDDWLDGGPGNDWITGNDGIDFVEGGDQDDLISGDAGPDDLRGGAGFDTVRYDSSFTPVVADLEGDRDDGVPGEADVIRVDVESLLGTRFNDRLSGNDAANVLRGGGGRDLLYGLGGDDLFLGGTNTFHGGPGFDTVAFGASTFRVVVTLDNRPDDGLGTNVAADVEGVVGSRFDDVIVGNARANLLRGGAGNDRIQGLDGNDVLIGDGGFDRLDGGPGTDTCRLGPHGGTLARCP